MILVRIKPEVPTSEPATINTVLPNIKPANAAAKPEYELSSAITTGISAPPMGSTKNSPSNSAKATNTITVTA